jgi:UDPglucose--hexose-1-phosphate uridylyltransferase
MQNELRRGPDSERWVLISSIAPSSVGCPLCPNTEFPGTEPKVEETFKITDKSGAWLCRSITDPYPITHPMAFKLKEGDDFYQTYYGHGWSEVVVETRDHSKELNDLNSEELKNVLLIYAARIKELNKKEGVEQVCIIKDNLHTDFAHAHSRIFTLPLVPSRIKEKLQKFLDFQYKNQECLYCNLLKRETGGKRVVMENENFIALVPFTQELPGQIEIFPKKHYRCLSELGEVEIFNLAEMIKLLLNRKK